jgi:two-component system osmolarity sensor histidine kinase EnvZ
LENAIRYGNGNPIQIIYSCHKHSLSITIIDNGLGIPSDKVDAVFRPFYRLETSRGSSTGGSGLGLAIVKQLADANHWKIQLMPRIEGGTKAVLTL